MISLRLVHSRPACPDFAMMIPEKTVFPGIGRDSLLKFHYRAQLLSTAGATADTERLQFTVCGTAGSPISTTAA